MHSPIMMRGRFEMADRAGHVSRLALWSLRGGRARATEGVDAPSVRAGISVLFTFAFQFSFDQIS
jgi:hypothetical protein